MGPENDALAVARYGTLTVPAPARAFRAGDLTLKVEGGAARGISFGGVEVVRCIACPVRDADWATLPDRTEAERDETRPDGFLYERTFRAGDAFAGRFVLEAEATPEGATLTADVRLEALRDVRVNRAGFVVLHPLRGVVGQGVRVRRPDGAVAEGAFPQRISPGQPLFDIAGLAHEVAGVAVDIAFEGDVFEMEDQRNWTDASFKTYCRPLSRPRPFEVGQGEVVAQRITLRLSEQTAASQPGADDAARQGLMPELSVALDDRVAPLSADEVAPLPGAGLAEALVRMTPERAGPALALAAPLGLPLSLEVVLPAGSDPVAGLDAVAAACADAGVQPARVLALPEPYLASHQPEGPWPEGPTPEDALEAARAAFPGAEVGAGMLTNFTELNRRPPRGGDFVSFGTTAIVHAAGDASVLETLEAVPDVLASARALAGARPLRLGLMSIGMRTNPYGSDVAPNPDGERVEMAREDPRQRGLFAAAFCVGLIAAAAEARVKSLAPAMADGPLGMADGDAARPIYHVVRALAARGGGEVTVSGGAGGLVRLDFGDGSGVAANLGAEAATLAHDGRAVLMDAEAVAAARAPDWLQTAPRASGPLRLEPLDVAFLEGGRTT